MFLSGLEITCNINSYSSPERAFIMNLYKFEITVNGFLLKTHFSSSEQSGLLWCKKYASKFQREVTNLEIKVAIYKKREAKERLGVSWEALPL